MFSARVIAIAFLFAAGAASAQPMAIAQAPTPTIAPPALPPALPPVVVSGDIVDTLKASGQFTILLKATDATNLTGFLRAQKNMTFFAPADTAFRALPPADLARLMTVPARAELQKLLIYHMVNARVPTVEFKGAVRSAPTMAGSPVELNGGDKFLVNEADITQADIITPNGVIHVIDKVLTPGWTPPAAQVAVAASAVTK